MSSASVAEAVGEEVKAAQRHARLPTNVVPSHYEVELRPDLAAAAFSASVKITVAVKSPTKTVVLNAAELAVQRATITPASGATLTAQSIEANEADEVLTLTFPSELGVGQAILEMHYTGILNDQMRGFYLSKYKDDKGVERFLGTTQFEATDCRRAIPSWDEPAIKATFAVSIVCASGLTALSNMPTTHQTPLADNPNLTRHVFDTTVPMSTYLLAFIVGEFDMIEGTTSEDTLVRCFATPGKGEQNRFALDFALQLLPFYSKWFDIPYALPKLDMVAVPDFSAGAMENWGLITYREAALLLDPAHSSAQTKQWVAVCVAHEIAHQWFGNLVTMEWWTHLWLNEGWATWMENYAVNAFFPEFKMWEQFVYSDLNTSFDLDSLLSSHPIEVPINHASEVDEIFDTISYSKGCVAIRMLEGLMGAEPFRRATVAYCKQFAYKNALTSDLWAAMSKEKGIDVSSIMNAWTTQTGFPILDLQENDSGDSRVLSFKVTQSRFLQDGPAKTAETWPVPVSFLVSGQKAGAGVAVGEQLFSAKEGVLTVQLPASGFEKASDASNFWVKLNAGQLGMYRVRYPPKMFAALCKAVAERDPLLSPADRLGVQSDAFALARCGLLSTVQLLQLVESYSTETEYTVWADLLSNLADLSVLLQPQPATYALFSAFMNRLLSKILAQIGWDKKPDEEHTVSLLRAKIIGVSGKYGDRRTIETGLQKYAAFLASGQALGGKDVAEQEEKSASASSSSSGAAASKSVVLSPDLRSAVYSMVVAKGGLFGYEALLYQHSQVTMSEEAVRCLQALASSTEPELLQRTLDYALSTLRAQDGPSLISAVAANRLGLQLTWTWLQSNWAAILVKWTQSSSLSRIVSSLSNLTTLQSKQQVEAFFASHAHPGAERAVKQAIERIESNAAWIARDYAATSEWLSQQQLEAEAAKQQQK